MQDYYYSNVFCPQHHSHCQHHWPMEKSLDASTLCYVAFQHHGSHHCHWQGQQWLSFLGWRWPRIQYSLVALAIVFQRLQQKQVRSRTSPSLNLCHGLCRPLQGSNSNNNILQQLQQQPLNECRPLSSFVPLAPILESYGSSMPRYSLEPLCRDANRSVSGWNQQVLILEPFNEPGSNRFYWVSDVGKIKSFDFIWNRFRLVFW